MARFYSASSRQELTLETATARGLTWDVFVSHTTNDDNLADSVATCIRSCGLTAWVDSDYLAPHDDGPGMASKIKRVIGRSYCLLAIVTNATNSSWWVPFEIGVASERDRYLSTYGNPRLSLPSFLSVWPRVKDDIELRSWCTVIKQQKAKHVPTTHRGFVEMAASHRSNYTREMKTLGQRFPGKR